MIESGQRVEEFKAEIAAMRLKDPATGRDPQLLRLGAALMVVGVGVVLVAYLLSHNTSDPLSQRDDIIVALGGVALSVSGAALFLRYSLAQFLRFWLARLIYEHQAQTDRLVDIDRPADSATTSGAGVDPARPGAT